jgi:hypothetical protein
VNDARTSKPERTTESPEESVGPAGCPACHRRRGRSFIRSSHELPDGTRIPHRELPPSCPACGEVPEQIVEIVEVMVETREALER